MKNLKLLFASLLLSIVSSISASAQMEIVDLVNPTQKITWRWDASGLWSFNIQLKGAGTITISWGDGSTETKEVQGIYNGSFSHEYKGKRNYEVLITATTAVFTKLNLSIKKVTYINTKMAPALQVLNVPLNKLKYLDLSRNPALSEVDCSNNEIEFLICLARKLDCSGNRIGLNNMHLLPANSKFGSQNNVRIRTSMDWQSLARISAKNGIPSPLTLENIHATLDASEWAITEASTDDDTFFVGETFDIGESLRNYDWFELTEFKVNGEDSYKQEDVDYTLSKDGKIKFLSPGTYSVTMRNRVFRFNDEGSSRPASIRTKAFKVVKK